MVAFAESEQLADEQLAHEQLAAVFPAVPRSVIASAVAAYRRVTPTFADAVRAAELRIDDARAFATESSIGSHDEPGRTCVAVFLTQDDLDRLNRGLPVDLQAPGHQGGTLSVHLMRERRHTPRTPEPAQVLAGEHDTRPHMVV